VIRIPISSSPDGRPEDWVFLAMANAKLARTTSQPNRPNLAWDWMRKLRDAPQFAQQIRLTNTGQVASGVPRSYPVDYLNLPLELLYDEALTVVRSNRPPPPAPAPTPAPARAP
jgi:hypothetical protein